MYNKTSKVSFGSYIDLAWHIGASLLTIKVIVAVVRRSRLLRNVLRLST